MNAKVLLSKVPWKVVLKVSGVTMIGVSSVMSAVDADKNVQKVVKILASKYLEHLGEKA